jgi:hypothetical protein
VRPLRLHCARHTWASLALEAGKFVRWVADQLGWADPVLTLRVLARVIPDEETDLSFLNFDGPERPQTAPPADSEPENENALDPTDRGRYENLARPTRLERVTFRSATPPRMTKIRRVRDLSSVMSGKSRQCGARIGHARRTPPGRTDNMSLFGVRKATTCGEGVWIRGASVASTKIRRNSCSNRWKKHSIGSDG